MKRCFIYILLPLLAIACSKKAEENKQPEEVAPVVTSSTVEFIEVDYSSSDQFQILFKIRDEEGNAVRSAHIERDSVHLFEDNKVIRSEDFEIQPLKQSFFSKNSTVSLLIDRSRDIPTADMEKIQEAVKEIVFNLPDSCVYISFFGDEISSTRLITRSNLETEFSSEFKSTDKNKSLYNAIYSKLQEFEGDKPTDLNYEKDYTQNDKLTQRAKRTYNYLVILTDGNDNPKKEIVDLINLNDYADNLKTELKIYAIRYGKNQEVSKYYEIDDVLRAICVARNLSNPNLRGDFFKAGSEDILSRFQDVTDDISADYSITLSNCGKIYTGNTEYRMIINGLDVSGSKRFTIGSPEKPVTITCTDVEGKGFFTTLLFGLLVGLLFLVVLFVILQLIIPLIKNRMFKAKHYKRYKPASGKELRKICSYCGTDIFEGDVIVDRCSHIVHKACWKENNYQCPEYGQNCKSGKQNYFNISDPFSRSSRQSYLYWIFYGLLGGWVAWMLYMLLFHYAPNCFSGFSAWMTETFYTKLSSQTEPMQRQIVAILQNKIQGLLSIGLILGFILSFLFSLIEDYRKKDFKVYLYSFIKACAGSILGFVAFFIGSIIMLLFSPEPGTQLWWLYSIPSYLLFGILIGLCLSFKSTISLKDGVLGGAASILIGTIILYTSSALLKEYGSMITFMIYGAGLGFSIATVRSYSERYFLKVNGEDTKEKKIAIHKWLNAAAGGSNYVFIGKANDCEIQMNWDKSNGVAKKHARLYYDRDRNVTMLQVLEPGVTYNKRIQGEKNKSYKLLHGDEFKIGSTAFQYYEEDR